MFGSAKRTVDFSPRADDKSHRLYHVNFSHPHMVVLAC